MRRNPQVTTRGEDYEAPLRVSRATRRLGIDKDQARDLLLLSLAEIASRQRFITSIGNTSVNVITLGSLDQSEEVIHLSDTSGGSSSTNQYDLPRASSSYGYRYRIKEIADGGDGITRVKAFGSELIDRSVIQYGIGLFQSVQFVCDGTEWWTI